MPRSALVALLLFACNTSDSTRTAGVGGTTTTPPPVNSSGHDWRGFNYDAARSGVSPDATGLTATNLPTMQRQQAQIDGTTDPSLLYLHNIAEDGPAHGVFFVTASV